MTTMNPSPTTQPDSTSAVEHRPWGYFEVLSSQASHKVKRLVVAAGAQLSDQRHQHRREHWAVVEGTGRVTLGRTNLVLSAGDSVMIAPHLWHRLANVGAVPLVLIETQIGPILAEEDIQRRADDYGRS